jgi:hypothetical protein
LNLAQTEPLFLDSGSWSSYKQHGIYTFARDHGHIPQLPVLIPVPTKFNARKPTMAMEEKSTLLAEQAQLEGQADSTDLPSVTLDADVARIIREEVIAAMNHQTRIKDSSGLPSYDSSIRQRHTMTDCDEEGQPINIRPKSKPFRESCMDSIRGALGLFAIIIIFTLWWFLLATGLDPMRFSLLALFLLLSVCVFLALVSLYPPICVWMND